MPKKYRLTGEEMRELSDPAAAKGRKRMHGSFFSVSVSPIAAPHAKCAIVVSSKVASRAVDRNTIKRRARSSAAKRVARVGKPLALVLYAKREAKDATFAQISDDIATLFSKL